MLDTIYTIGHSTYRSERFVELLQMHRITALADVRSAPYSRFNPQYNKAALKKTLLDDHIQYVFLGEELGARSKDPNVYDNGRVSYRKLAATPLFQSGLNRLIDGMRSYTIAMMCAEKEPLDCHRTMLVAPELEKRGVTVMHILEDGSLESHTDAIARLVRQLKIPEDELFRDNRERSERAYALQSHRIAYVDKSNSSRSDDHHS